MPNHAQVELIGHLGKDPEMKTAKSGKTFGTVSIAVTNKRGDEPVTAWFNLTMFGQTANFACDYLKKGEAVFITGDLNARPYEHNGEKRMSLDVIVNRLVSVGRQPQKKEGEVEDDVPF